MTRDGKLLNCIFARIDFDVGSNHSIAEYFLSNGCFVPLHLEGCRHHVDGKDQFDAWIRFEENFCLRILNSDWCQLQCGVKTWDQHTIENDGRGGNRMLSRLLTVCVDTGSQLNIALQKGFLDLNFAVVQR